MSAIISQMGWDFQLVTTGPFSLEANKIFNSLSAAETYVKTDPTAYVGNVISVVGDEKAKNNGVYLVTAVGENGALVGAGSGAGSEAIASFTIVENKVSEATADNIGQIIYVTTGTEAYPAGPYIVTGVGAVAKLGTTTATGDIAGDVENLKGRMSTAEGEIDALQDAVGDANSGLVKGLADANDAIDAVEGRMDTAEDEIDALQTAVGNAESGLVADVAGIKTTIGNAESGLVADIAANAEAIEANTTAVAELRQAVAGGVHFIGTTSQLPWEGLQDTTIGQSLAGTSDTREYNVGDIIIVASGGNEQEFDEPTKEYILVYGNESEENDDVINGYRWVELGDVSPADQKIADLEKDFDDHVKAMETAWSEHLKEADDKYATIANLEAAEQAAAKALEDHVAAMATTIANAADYAASKGSFALADNVVAKGTFNQHVADADTRMDDINAAILAVPVKSVAADTVLKLSDTGALSVDMSNFVTKDGDKVLSTNDFTNELKAKLDGVAAGAQVNVIETIQVNGTPISVEGGKVVNIDLGAYAKSADVVSKTLTINTQALTDNIVLDAQDIAIVGNVGDSAAGSSVEAVLGALHTAVVETTGVANTALQTVIGSNAIAVTDKNNIALVVKSGSALTVGTDGLDLVWTEL